MKLADLYAEIARMHREGIPGAVATVVSVRGSTPRAAGAKMIVYADGRALGTVGGGGVEAEVIARARDMAGAGGRDLPGAAEPALLHFDLRPDAGAVSGVPAPDAGMACGGSMDVFLEPIRAGALVAVIGGGHVGQAVAAAARQAGFRVRVVDDRADVVSAERFPGAERRLVGGPELVHDLEIDGETFVVVVTRGHRYDKEWVKAVLPARARYLGMIGSEEKVRGTFDDLAREGVPAEDLARVHAPIGLDIGAETPDEIAVSVVAELLAVKHGIRDTAMLRDKRGMKGRNR